MTTVDKRKQIRESLKDTDYRHQFVEEEINVGIAFQIRSLRNRQNMTQEELSKKLDKRQPLVSSWENPNYGKYTLATLKELAKAFDVGLLVKFVPFSTLIDWSVNLKPESIAPPSFNEEQSSYFWQEIIEDISNNSIDANQIENTASSLDANFANIQALTIKRTPSEVKVHA
ncbi:MAG: helix-turn-helix transcriptional regulator [Dehalococcoidales bacterium]|nr:helix-turn-helix transcriptional regulator [Dehalococcoidales bacterium]